MCAPPGRPGRWTDSSGKSGVYSITDQDDTGPWIRREFPKLFYIVQPSTQKGDDYYYATWTGISGDVYYRNGAGADSTLVTNEWLDANIRSKGPLGKLYPRFAFIMEGDTPSFLGLIDNGLNAYRRPDWGGWGGRYIYRQPYGEKSRHLDPGRQHVFASHLAGHGRGRGWQGVHVRPGNDLALARSLSERFCGADGLDH